MLVCHAYAFFNDLFSHDALNALYASGVEERWKVELGRFVFPVYRTIFRGALATPWIIGLLTIVWVTLAVYVLAKVFGLQTFAPIFFAAGILAVNRTMFCLGATYLYELDIDMLSVFLAVLSVYIWKSSGRFGFLWGALPLVGTLGIYQCNISVAAVLVIFVLVLALVRGELNAKEAFRKGLLSLAMFVIAALIYLVILKLISWVFGIEPVSGYYNSITNALAPKTRGIFSLLVGMYRDYRKTVFYWPTTYPSVLVMCAVLLSLLASVAQLMWLAVRKKASRNEKCWALLLAAALLLLLPAASNLAYVLNNGDVHDLMKYAVWMVFLLAVAEQAMATSMLLMEQMEVTRLSTLTKPMQVTRMPTSPSRPNPSAAEN
ncbi:MAG: glucosyltransferase domain-containing protein [Firmicutes bacterium]|nr:glucosyltransferase domain-containing protein [Bacillota bacterium]